MIHLKISIITVGKIKEKYLSQGIDEYLKRLQPYTKLQIIEVPDEKAPESLSEKEMDLVKEKEGERILSKLPSDSYVIALSIQGNTYSSEEFAIKMESIKTYNASHITFIIGGSLGLSNSVIQKTNLELSFSTFTFPHQLMRLILLEQLYRSFRINNNEPYHK